MISSDESPSESSARRAKKPRDDLLPDHLPEDEDDGPFASSRSPSALTSNDGLTVGPSKVWPDGFFAVDHSRRRQESLRARGTQLDLRPLMKRRSPLPAISTSIPGRLAFRPDTLESESAPSGVGMFGSSRSCRALLGNPRLSWTSNAFLVFSHPEACVRYLIQFYSLIIMAFRVHIVMVFCYEPRLLL